MNWYYEKYGSAQGPVSQAEFEAHKLTGEIDASTPVWREGWPRWRLAREVWDTGGRVLPPTIPTTPTSSDRCVECGTAQSEMVQMGGASVCLACKPTALSKIREGLPIGSTTDFTGPWRDGKILIVSKRGAMPDCCVKCGAPPTRKLHRTLAWHEPLIYLAIFLGLIIYLILALCLRKTASLQVPLCAACDGRRVRNLVIGWAGFLLSIALFFLSAYAWDESAELGQWLLIGGFASLLFCVFWAVCVQLLVARKITNHFAWIKKASPNALATLPPWPGA